MKATTFSNRISGLIEENRAAESAYSQVLPGIQSKDFGQLLDNCIEERIRFQQELEEAMSDSEVELTTDEVDAHPSWLHIREIFPTGNDSAMLDEVIRAEQRSLDMYESIVIDPHLPEAHAAVLRNHIRSLNGCITALEKLRPQTA